MRIGEVVSALSLCCSSVDDLLFVKTIYNIEVVDDHIEVYFVDANTPDIKINKDGTYDYL